MNYVSVKAKNDAIQLWQLGDDIYNKTFGEWTAEFWKWLTKFPLESGPGRSETCDLTQTDPDVFFLAGFFDRDGEPGDPNESRRNCVSIEDKKSILIGVINKLCTTEETKDLITKQLLVDRANMIINKVEKHSAVIDGNEIDLERVYYPFELNLENDVNNYFGEDTKINTNAVSDGYWLFLRPESLGLGSHILHIEGSGPDADGELFSTNVTYDVKIV